MTVHLPENLESSIAHSASQIQDYRHHKSPNSPKDSETILWGQDEGVMWYL